MPMAPGRNLTHIAEIAQRSRDPDRLKALLQQVHLAAGNGQVDKKQAKKCAASIEARIKRLERSRGG